ncbi:GNAT family N-acetyltransferase [Pseudoprimorskyibacter insulae]|uniref:N-acetyltransferase domain-containing protein n=1 Tax=Pseudoprimorskyibacter insulae TaxID=1695997 RepID=A0A2R8APR3_9RHOB|nr:GNAT family protein [Pseudoprimorskyibacter insulae]SPF78032.1 hypothetical protein PRI8871_00621 [Pseudoprimorskyibacter insulae]
MISFARLTEISPDLIVDHMSDPRVAEHMPLLQGQFTHAAARAFVGAKEKRWQQDGLGHWAFLHNGDYVGWGGFQKEGDEWDYGLVLRPDAFGLGQRITRQAFAFARAKRLTQVTFLLPPTRRSLGALQRLGAEFVGESIYSGKVFRKYRLSLLGPARGRTAT